MWGEHNSTPLHPYKLGTGLQSQGPPQYLKVWDLEVSSKFDLWQLQQARKAASKQSLTSPLMGIGNLITPQEEEISTGPGFGC